MATARGEDHLMSGSLPGGLGGRREANGGVDGGIGGRLWLLKEKRKEKLAAERQLMLVVRGEEGELVEENGLCEVVKDEGTTERRKEERELISERKKLARKVDFLSICTRFSSYSRHGIFIRGGRGIFYL